jgi:hypothetical protein
MPGIGVSTTEGLNNQQLIFSAFMLYHNISPVTEKNIDH